MCETDLIFNLVNGALSSDLFEILNDEAKVVTLKKVKQGYNCPPRIFNSVDAIGNSMLIIGGMTDAKTVSNDIYWASTNNGFVWRERAKLPHPICGHATCSVGDLIYIFGGYNKGGFTNDFYFYELLTDIVAKVVKYKVPISPRSGCSMVESKGQ